MGSCGSCIHKPAPTALPDLCAIRHGYRTQWNGLTLAVETDAGDWALRIHDSAGRQTLYTARRPAVRAAQVAAAEFAIFQVLGPASRVSPDRLAGEMNWQEYW